MQPSLIAQRRLDNERPNCPRLEWPRQTPSRNLKPSIRILVISLSLSSGRFALQSPHGRSSSPFHSPASLEKFRDEVTEWRLRRALISTRCAEIYAVGGGDRWRGGCR